MSKITVTEALLDAIASGRCKPQKGVAWAVKTSSVPFIIQFGLENDPTKYRYIRLGHMGVIQKEIQVSMPEWVKVV